MCLSSTTFIISLLWKLSKIFCYGYFFLYFILWKFHPCIQHILVIATPHSLPQILPDIFHTSPSQLHDLFVFVFFFLITQIMLPMCGQVGYPLGHRQLTNVETLKEKWLSSPNNQSTPNSSTGRCWASNFSSIHTGIFIAFFLQVTTTATLH